MAKMVSGGKLKFTSKLDNLDFAPDVAPNSRFRI